MSVTLGDAEGASVASALTDANGAFTVSWTVSSGSYAFYAVDDRTQYPVNVPVVAP